MDGPNELWVSDVTEYPTAGGKVYLAVVLDAWSRMVIGWSIADHIRSELVVDALQMAIWRRRPAGGKTICHTDHGSQDTSWAFGRRLRAAGLLGSMGLIGDCLDNSLAESFFGTLQLELLDRHHWQSRDQLASAIFDYVEAFYNPRRRHSSIGNLSPAEFESRHLAEVLGHVGGRDPDHEVEVAELDGHLANLAVEVVVDRHVQRLPFDRSRPRVVGTSISVPGGRAEAALGHGARNGGGPGTPPFVKRLGRGSGDERVGAHRDPV